MGSFRLALRLSGLLAVAACTASETGPQGPPDGTDGATAVFLTDAPFPFDGVARVDIHIVDIALSPQTDTSDGLPGWVTVATPTRRSTCSTSRTARPLSWERPWSRPASIARCG